jgi:uncharacterized protein YqeY
MSLKIQLTEAMKEAMRAKDSARLGVIRMALAAFKQIEVDERIEVDEVRSLAIVEKLIKQRRESVTAFTAANRFYLHLLVPKKLKLLWLLLLLR